MKIEELNIRYDELQKKYGSRDLDPIYNGGCSKNPDIFFVFMNPTARNIASSKSWKGLKAPWIGIKNVWTLFYQLNLLSDDIYSKIRSLRGCEWTYSFADEVYADVCNHKYFLTNLGKCSQDDARVLPDSVFKEYLNLLEMEIDIVNPKVIILFGNQVSSIVLNQKISVSKCRKKCYKKNISGKTYRFFPVYYPVGNGSFNTGKAIEDIKYIIDSQI